MQVRSINYQNNINNNNNKYNRANNSATPRVANNSVSFTGIGKLDPRNVHKLGRLTEDMLNFAPGILDLEPKMVHDTLRRSSRPQKHFFALLTEKYNCHNYYAPENKKENARVILTMVDKVQFPTDAHFKIAGSKQLTVTDTADAMERLNYSGRKISKFLNIARDITKETRATSGDLVKILHSEHSGKYMRHYSDYAPYFKRHIGEKDAIKNLDEMVSKGTYDAVKERNTYELEKKVNQLHLSDVVNVEKLAPHSSDESISVLTLLDRKLSPCKLKDKTNYSENLSEIFSTTTKDNLEARVKYLRSYVDVQGVHEFHRDEMDNVTKLFRRMDEDPSVMDFVANISKPESNVVGAGEILRVIDNVSPKKRELYHEQIGTILSSGKENVVDKAIRFASLQPDSKVDKTTRGLKKYVRSLFTPTTARSKYRRTTRIMQSRNKKVDVPESLKPEVINNSSGRAESVEPKVPTVVEKKTSSDVQRPIYVAPKLPKLSDILGGNNKIKFNVPVPVVSTAKAATAERPAITTLPALIQRDTVADIFKPAYVAPTLPKMSELVGGNKGMKFDIPAPAVSAEKTVKAERPAISTLPAIIYDIPKINIPAPSVEKASEAVVETVAKETKATKTKEPKVIKRGIFANRTAKQPSAQKLQIISDVKTLIEKKLGKNTLADQSKSYERGANKMRLGMLPDIFESIKETRAQKRVAGTFSKTKSESNADALALYNMINGRNKRLVNYMLKVRDKDGSRIYSVKDIIAVVGDTEKSIRMSKLQGTPISAADAKTMYSTMLDEQVAQHGKLPRAKAKKK